MTTSTSPDRVATTGTGTGTGTPTASHTLRAKLKPKSSADGGVIAVRYEQTQPARPPIPVTVAPPRAPPTDTHPALRRARTDDMSASDEEAWKRDSGLAPTTSSKAREGSVNTLEETAPSLSPVPSVHERKMEEEKRESDIAPENAKSLPDAPVKSLRETHTKTLPETHTKSLPETNAKSLSDMTKTHPEVRVTNSLGSQTSSIASRWRRPSSSRSSRAKTPPMTIARPASVEDFAPLTTSIPTDSLLEDDFLDKLSFSKRGSVMLSGKRAVNRPVRTSVAPSFALLVSPSPSTSTTTLPLEVELESRRVRAMYETGAYIEPSSARSSAIESQTTLEEEEEGEAPPANGLLSPTSPRPSFRPGSAMSTRSESAVRAPHERAGGIEDWEDVQGGEVDRYGFISLRRDASRPGTPEPRSPQRVSTALQLASEAPRRRRAFGRAPSTTTRSPARKISAPSLRSATTGMSTASRRSHLRAAANRLPGNRDRRWMDEAGDMLTLPPGLADIAEDAEGGRAADSQKRREWERAEKWRRMATVVRTPRNGEGMAFEFDVRNPKLVERTWKGIPDIWRAAAWHSFLTTSARRRGGCATDEQLVAALHRLQDQASADDVQIDIDVPRTINSHIMFRRRYRGGQRLLFRVLHALALYFPATGYVQGMASLAATLLCYYDEDRTFIMLVRMWTLRGLDKLYESGFSGLMAALDEFQTGWLDGDEVTQKLSDLSIDPTAYGTRWYLTLFNYSIPFQAQLRVWDVFMLLGDADPTIPTTPGRPFAGGLDVLHATSAALIDGTREILLDSDFENAMKVLTSWIPVKDEELLMKVTKAEWKRHHARRKA